MNACRRLRLSGGIVPLEKSSGLSNPFHLTAISQHISRHSEYLHQPYRIMKSFYNSGTGMPPRSPLERFKRRWSGHVTARRRCASGCSLQFRQQIDGARGADAPPCDCTGLHLDRLERRESGLVLTGVLHVLYLIRNRNSCW